MKKNRKPVPKKKPASPEEVAVLATFPTKQHAALVKLAKSLDTSVREQIRQAVAGHLASH